MNTCWRFIVKLFIFIQILQSCESIFDGQKLGNDEQQERKQQQAEINSSRDQLSLTRPIKIPPTPPPPSPSPSPTATTITENFINDNQQQQEEEGEDEEARQHYRKSDQYDSSRHSNDSHNNRYNIHGKYRLAARRHRQHSTFTSWSLWSKCNEDCVQRRERYCRQKWKCGHTKQIEERKCWRCPAEKVQPNYNWTTTTMIPIVNGSSHVPLSSIIMNAAVSTTTSISRATVASNNDDDIDIRTTSSASERNRIPTEFSSDNQSSSSSSSSLLSSSLLLLFPNETANGTRNPQVEAIKNAINVTKMFDAVADVADTTDNNQFRFYILRQKVVKRRRHSRWRKENFHNNDDDIKERNSTRVITTTTATTATTPTAATVLSVMKNRKRKLLHFDDSVFDGDIFQYEDFDIDMNHDDSNHFGDDDESLSSSSSSSSMEDNNDYDVEQKNLTSIENNKERAAPDFAVPIHRRLYSKWSRWTKCSPKCTTRRYKKCRIREQCGREVLREIAYCYTEGSFCQQWLYAQLQKSPAYEVKPMSSRRRQNTDSLLSNSIYSDFIMNSKGYRGPEYAPMKLKCGIPNVRTNRRNLYNMLKIIGGKASKKGEWPWQVAIFNRFKEAFCGGTLIAPQWILTAAHCVRKVLYVRLGEHNLDYEDGSELQLRVLKSYKHPNFDKKTVDSDVALLRLPKAINATTWIGYSCLPQPYQPLPKYMDCTVIGWGKRRNRDVAGTSILHQADVPIIPMENCRSVYQDYTITKNMFCAGHKRGRIDTCAGDSGGPLLCRDTTRPNHPWTIFGITSFGDGCAKRNKFGIYAKVPNYVDWIWSVINCNGNCKMFQRI